MSESQAAAVEWRHNPRVVDLSDFDTFADGAPHEAFAKLRRGHPVYWNEEIFPAGPGYWSLTRYADIEKVSRDPQTFSSAQGINIIYPPELDPEIISALVGGMITMDPPLHNAYRKIALPWFTKTSIAGLEAMIERHTESILDEALERGEVDFMEDIAAPLPIAVLCEILGVPDSDRRRIFEWSNTLVGGNDPELNPSGTPPIGTYMELFQYGLQMIEARRGQPIEDLMSAVANARTEDGEEIPRNLLNGFFLLMVIAGNETTRNSISGGMVALLEHPDELARLRQDASLLPKATEEILRWVTPVVHMRRTATRDTEIRGVPVAEGDKVVMWYPSANRDEAVFAQPDHFDVGRDPNPHLAFGVGQHFCLGANLARLQLRVMFRELLRRVDSVELTGAVTRIRTNFLAAIKKMPVRVTSA